MTAHPSPRRPRSSPTPPATRAARTATPSASSPPRARARSVSRRAPITVSGKQIELSNIEIGPDGTTARKIYRALGTGAFQLLTTISNNVDTDFVDNLATASGAATGTSPLYIDVTYTSTPGATLDYGSILDSGAEFTVSGTGASGLTFTGAPKAIAFVQDATSGALVATVLTQGGAELLADFYTRLAAAGVKTFRYDATAGTAWGVGSVHIDFNTFTAGGDGWQDSLGNAGLSTDHLYVTVQGPTGQIADPQGGSGIDVNTLNGRNYIDVTLPTAPSGYTIDPGSITDLAPEFQLTGSGIGSVAIDSSQAPLLLANGQYRYWLNGEFSSTPTTESDGSTLAPDVMLTWLAGSWSYTLNTPQTTPANTTVPIDDPAYMEVVLPDAPAGYTIDPHSVTAAAITLTDATSAMRTIFVDSTVAPTLVAGELTTFRFRIRGSYNLASNPAGPDSITLHINTGTWSFIKTDDPQTPVDYNDLSGTNERSYIDVTFAPVSGGQAVTTDAGAVTIGGSGIGTIVLAGSTGTPVALSNGHVRYYLTGHFDTGSVDVTFHAGKLHSGTFTNLESVASFTSQGPTADLVDPGAGAIVGAGTLNNRGYVDVTFNLFGHTAAQIDESTITDDPAEFVIRSGSFTGTLALDTTQAPVRVGTSNVWRYWTTGSVASGTPILDWTLGSYGFTDSMVSGVVTASTLTGAAATAATHYLDVRLSPTAGDALGAITSGILTLGGSASAGVTLQTTTPTQLPGTSTYRFYFTGNFVAGALDVAFVSHSFTSGGHQNNGETEEMTIQQLTADVADPTSGGTVGAGVLNDRGYFDVTYHVPDYASSIDVASVTDLDPEFTVSGANVTLDATRAPVLVSHTGADYVFRYFYTGDKTGSLTLNFIGGTVNYLDAAGNAIPLFQQREFIAYQDPRAGHTGEFVIDVPYGETSTLSASSITDDDATNPEVTATGGYTLTLITDSSPISGTTGTYRYRVTGTGIAAGTHVVVTYNPANWTYGTTAGVLQASQNVTLADHTFIDVAYSGAPGIPLDPTSLTGDEITISGAGSGTGITVLTGAHGTTNAPSILSDGTTVRYYLTGHFTPGQVTVTFVNGSWADHVGDLGVGGTATFQVIDQLTTADVQTASNPSPSRVFFIEISGKMLLQAFGFTDEPILEIRGKVVLEIGQVHIVDHDVAQFTLDASGTVKVIKLGNIASGAAHFVLQVGGGLGDTKLYGVAAFETNLAFLHPYADLTGRIVLMINTDSIEHDETISLEGVPGDAIFALDSATSATALAALSSATGSLFNKIALPGDWITRFEAPGPGPAGVIHLDHGTDLTPIAFSGLTADDLTGAKIEKVSAAGEFRVSLVDGRQYFIQSAVDASSNNILVVKGEAREYALAAQSFSLAVVGRFVVDDPGNSSNDFQDPSKNWIELFGAFYVQITTSKLTVFATAEGSFLPLGLSGHETGLLILNYGSVGTAGIAGMFDLGLSADPPPGSGGLSNIADVFTFEGRVQVMFNTTLVEQDFSVPSVFRDLLPLGSPTHYTIFKSIPSIDGSGELDPTSAGQVYISATISGTITLFNTIALTGFLQISIGIGPEDGAVVIAGAVGTTIQYIGTLSGTIHFLFFSDYMGMGPGLIGRASLALADGGAIPGVSIGGQVILEVNTFVGAIAVNTFELDANGNLVFDSHGPVFAVQDIGSNNPDEDFDVRLVIKGHADISIIHLDGSFIFVLKFAGGFRIAASLDANMTFGSFGGVHVDGSINIDADGFALRLSATLDANFGNSLGLNFNVSGTVELNTSNRAKTMLDGHIVQPGFFLALHGDVEFVGFASASGDVMLRINASTFELSFNVQLHLGPIDVAASGFAGIYTDTHPGIVLRLAVSLDVNVLDIIKISASGELRLNTTDIARNANGVSIGADSFRLSLNGSIKILDVINLSASFDLIVGGGNVTVGSGVQRKSFDLASGEWVFAFAASADFFGFASMSVSGWIDSRGEFDVQLSGQMTLGSSSFGLVGQFSVRVYLYKEPLLHFHLDFSAEVSARLFGFSFASLGIDGSFDALQTAGQDHIDIIVSVTVRIKILFIKVSKTATFNIGTIRIPPPIFLAGDEGPGDGSSAGQIAWNGGALYLNMGPRASVNGLGSGIDEGFTVEATGGTASGQTIKVTSGGRSQTFAGVTSIHAFGGSGNDQILVKQGVLVPVVLDGGDGNDAISYFGSGSATLTGGNGDDFLEVGDQVTGPVVLNGGNGDDFLVDDITTTTTPLGITMIGGGGNDSIYGGSGNDTIYGDQVSGEVTSSDPAVADGSDDINGGGGIDTVSAGGNDDVIKVNMPATATPSISGGSGHDFLVVTATTGNDNLTVESGGSNTVRIRQTIGAGTITASGIEELDIDLAAGADQLFINPLAGTGVALVAVNAGQIVTNTGQFQLISDPDNPNGLVKQPIVTIAPDNAADTITINGSSGADNFSVTGVDPVNDRMTDVRVVHAGDADVLITKQIRNEGDRLVIDGQGGNDRLDASGLGGDGTPTVFPDLIAVTLRGNTGDDTLIGSPFNDVLDGGTGSDRFTGGPGLDTFLDGSLAGSGDIDTLVENFDQDMSLFQDTFIVGELRSNDGSTAFSQPGYVAEPDIVTHMTNDDLPSFRNGLGDGDHYTSSATVESINGIFEAAILTGGTSNNTIVVNDSDNTVYIGGVARAVTPWQGHATLDNAGNSTGLLTGSPERYVIAVVQGNHARIDIVDSGGGSGADELVVFGTSNGDNLHLNAAGSGAFRVGIIDVLGSSTTHITYRQVERVSIYTLGGNDSVLSDDTAVTTVIDLGGGDDHLTVGTVPLIPDTGNRTLEFPDGVPVADTDNMTNGNSGPLFAIGGGQNDTFEVNHNRAKLYLAGSDGDDTFLLKTFIALRENPLDASDITNLTTLFGGTGMNRYEYVQNAPVQINGGPGTDTLVVIGTPIGDDFVVTDTYVAGAGRITDFTSIERIEIDGAGGPDRIWILSTSPSIETIVDGGTGDDQINIGGTPPLLVFDPPSFTYTPPAFQVQLPPVVSYHDETVDLGGWSFTVSLAQWLAAGGNIFDPSSTPTAAANLASSIAGHIGTLRSLFDPLTTFTGVSVTGATARLRFSFIPFFFDTVVEVDVSSVQLHYSVGTVTQETKLIQPPSITVDPPAFAFQAAGVTDLSGIQGRLTIRGGDAPEGLGDTVIVHNEASSFAGSGGLQTFTQPRWVQTGQDGAGNPIVEQDADISGPTPVPLFDSFLELSGMGLGISSSANTALNGRTVFHGIELQGIESIDIRLAGGNDTFTVADTGFGRNTDGSQNATLLPTTLAISGGGGDDTINLQQVGGATRIIGGAGADTVNIHSTTQTLAQILGRVSFDGDATITEPAVPFLDNDPRLAIFLTARSVIVPVGVQLTTSDASARPYHQADIVPVLFDPSASGGTALQVRVVVLNPTTGAVTTEFVQEKGVLEYAKQKRDASGNRLWFANDGGETTDSSITGIPVLLAATSTTPGAEQVFMDASFNKVLTPTSHPSYTTDFTGSNLFIDNDGFKTTTDTGRPSLIEINSTTLVPFQRVLDTVTTAPSTGDVLNIVNTGDTTNITGTLDQIHVALQQLDVNGRVVLHDAGNSDTYDFANAPMLTYSGGEPVIDPFTGVAMTYVGGEEVRDLFTRALVLDPFGNVVLHHAGDPLLHYRGDPVVHTQGEVQRYLGGEIATTETGTQVMNPDGTFLRRLPDQAIIYNRFDPVYNVTTVQLPTQVSATFTVAGLGGVGVLHTVTVIDRRQTGNSWIYTLVQGVDYTVSGDTITFTGFTPTAFTSVNVTLQTPATHQLGDGKFYFGTEAVQIGEPVVDSTNNPVLDSDGNVVLYTAATILKANGQPILHKRGAPVLVLDPEFGWIPATYSAAEAALGLPVLRLGNEPKLYLGGETAYASGASAVTVDTTLSHISLAGDPNATGPSGMPGDATYANLEDVRITTGSGDDLFTIVNTHTGTTELSTTGGNDDIAVRTISGATTIDAGTGNDIVAVGSTAGLWNTVTPAGVPPTNPQFVAVNGVVDFIAATLTIHGGTGENTLNVDDSGDLNNNVGQLTSTQITGLDMGGLINYDGFADDLNIVLGHGNDVFTVVSTHAGLTTIQGRSGRDEIDVRTIAGETRIAGDGFTPTIAYGTNTISTGADDDTINVGTLAGFDANNNFNGNLQGIDALLVVQGSGQTDVDRLVVDDSGDATGRVGVLTSTDITGLGLSAAGIHYTQIEALHLMLGLGNDAFHVDSTHAGTTRVNGGPGNDSITVNSIQGGTQIDGDDPVLPASETYAVVSADFVRIQQILDSLLAVAVRNGSTLLSYGTDYTFVEGTKQINFTHPQTGTITVSYNLPLTNLGASINFTRGPPLPSTTTYDDTVTVNVDQAGNETHLNGIGALLSIDGQHGSDHTTAYLAGATYYLDPAYLISTIDVHDSGAPAGDGTNLLDLYGPDKELVSDNFLLRQNFVALMPTLFQAERVNYDTTQSRGLRIYGRAGDDTFTLDDNSVSTTIDGGSGDDTFQVGQIFQSPREVPQIPATSALDVFETIATTRGYLSNGISFDTTIFGGQGHDSFTVFHNKATLVLDGGSGDDTFTVRAFAARLDPIDPNQHTTNIIGGLGDDFIQYTDNAPVSIDGGDGIDTVVVIGTEFGDTFVITDDRRLRRRPLRRVHRDRDPQGRRPGGQRPLRRLGHEPRAPRRRSVGGLGSDSFEVGGSVDGQSVTVSSRDLTGHSGLIFHSITSTDGQYGTVVIDGVSASVADNDDSAVITTPLGPMQVYESATGTPNPADPTQQGIRFASYSVVLSRAPVGGNVFINVSPPELSSDDVAAGARPLEFYDPLTGHIVDSLVLTFTAGNWFIPQIVYVVAQEDGAAQGGEREVTQQFTMPSDGTTASFILATTPLSIESISVGGLRIRQSEATLTGQTVALNLANAVLAGTAVSITYVLQDGSTSFLTIRHSVSGLSAPNFVGVAIPTVVVQKFDDDAAGVAITQSGQLTAFEGGADASYTVSLTKAPTAGETITVALSTDPSRLTLSAVQLQFTAANWNIAQTVTVHVVSDSIVQGEQIVSIHHTVTSSNLAIQGVGNYTGIDVPDVTVKVEDNDVAGVLIQESNGSTRVIEGGATDSYTVVLTKAPTADVIVHVQPGLTQSGGTINQTFTGGPLQSFTLAQTPVLVARVTVDGLQLTTAQYTLTGATLTILPALRTGAQVAISYRVVNAGKTVLVSATGAAGSFVDGIDLTFTAANWNIAQTVYVQAVDNAIIDGDAVKVFPPLVRSTSGIQGPLTIEGGTDPSGVAAIPPPVLYVGESDPHLFVAPPNPNFDALEPEQVDVLSILNTDSVADSTGVLDDGHITGLGMGGNRIIGGTTYAGGVVYSDIELLRIDLGNGNDKLLVNETHGNDTIVNAGPGNDQIFVRNIAGPTTINGQSGNDTVSVGTAFDSSLFGAGIDHQNAPPAGTIDRIRGLLRVDGGTGADTVNVDDSGDPTADAAIITGSTVDGMDFATSPVLTYSIVNATGGTYTLTIAGLTTAPIGYLDLAAAVKAAILALGIPNVTDVVVNRAGDTFTLGFVGGENLTAASLTIATDAAGLTFVPGAPASMSSAVSAQSLTQTVDVHATTGTFTVSVAGGAATFQFTVGATADQFRDALITALRTLAPLSADGIAVGVKDVVVDQVGTAYIVTYLGLLRGLLGDAYGLTVPPNSLVTGYDVTINAVGGTFTLGTANANSAGATRTWALGWNASAADIAAALSTLYGVAVTVTANPGPINMPASRVLHVAGLSEAGALDRRPQPRQPALHARAPFGRPLQPDGGSARHAEHRPRLERRRRCRQRPGHDGDHQRLRPRRQRPLLRLEPRERDARLRADDGLPRGQSRLHPRQPEPERRRRPPQALRQRRGFDDRRHERPHHRSPDVGESPRRQPDRGQRTRAEADRLPGLRHRQLRRRHHVLERLRRRHDHDRRHARARPAPNRHDPEHGPR